jgi:predicted dehydrogenase
VLEALAAGKHVFVEKPLCLTEAELQEIISAYDGTRLLMVGFNRRFAPLAQEVKKFLAGSRTPLVMSYRVKAGYIPQDSWVHDPEVGGGRLLGEVCHFLDFLHYLSGSPAVQVSAVALSGALGQSAGMIILCCPLPFRMAQWESSFIRPKGPNRFPGKGLRSLLKSRRR